MRQAAGRGKRRDCEPGRPTVPESRGPSGLICAGEDTERALLELCCRNPETRRSRGDSDAQCATGMHLQGLYTRPFAKENMRYGTPHDYQLPSDAKTAPSFSTLPCPTPGRNHPTALPARGAPRFAASCGPSPGPAAAPAGGSRRAHRACAPPLREKCGPRGPGGSRAHASACRRAGSGFSPKMAAAVTFCRLLGRSGSAALRPPRGARCLGVRASPTGEKITHTGQVSAAAWRPPRLGSRRTGGRAPCRPGSGWAQVCGSRAVTPRGLPGPRPPAAEPGGARWPSDSSGAAVARRGDGVGSQWAARAEKRPRVVDGVARGAGRTRGPAPPAARPAPSLRLLAPRALPE